MRRSTALLLIAVTLPLMSQTAPLNHVSCRATGPRCT